MNRTVSIITPAFNSDAFINDTILSVRSQTYPHWEMIIVDDGSTDGTVERVLRWTGFDRRIRLFPLGFHSGLPAVARNFGMAKISGDFIAFLDSDDLWMPSKLEKQVQLLREDKTILAVATRAEVFPKKRSRIRLPGQTKRVISFRELLMTNTIVNSSVLMRKEVIDRIGLLDENPIFKAINDYDYWLRILRYEDKSLMILNSVLVKYRIHATNICSSPDKVCLPEFYTDEYQQLCALYQKHKEGNSSYISKVLQSRWRRALRGKMRSLLMKKQISFLDFVKSSEITLYDKMVVLFRLYYPATPV